MDRSGTRQPDFGCPFVSLMQLDVETFDADKTAPDLRPIPTMKPGSR
jgi:orotate phosphoribosyltransferase